MPFPLNERELNKYKIIHDIWPNKISITSINDLNQPQFRQLFQYHYIHIYFGVYAQEKQFVWGFLLLEETVALWVRSINHIISVFCFSHMKYKTNEIFRYCFVCMPIRTSVHIHTHKHTNKFGQWLNDIGTW